MFDVYVDKLTYATQDTATTKIFLEHDFDF